MEGRLAVRFDRKTGLRLSGAPPYDNYIVQNCGYSRRVPVEAGRVIAANEITIKVQLARKNDHRRGGGGGVY